MKWYKIFCVCIKPPNPTPDKRESVIENINVFITNERPTDYSFNKSESCNSIISELSETDDP